MKLNINFNKKLEPLINSSEELSDWFEKNQDTMAYLELTHPNCLHFENNSMASTDTKVLGRMANTCLIWLETTLPNYSDEEKVENAILSIADIYYENYEKISLNAKEKYFISTEKYIKQGITKHR